MNWIKTLLALSLFALGALPAHARDAKPDPLAIIAPLVGDWTGTGEGVPGFSAATRHTTRSLEDKYIKVEGRSVYPKQEKNKTGETHVSIDMWSYDKQRKLIVMRQFDNLGFVSTYVQDRAASTNGRLVMVSEHIENVPPTLKARYTYTFPASDEYREHFELDENGKGFEAYVSGRFLRDKP